MSICVRPRPPLPDGLFCFHIEMDCVLVPGAHADNSQNNTFSLATLNYFALFWERLSNIYVIYFIPSFVCSLKDPCNEFQFHNRPVGSKNVKIGAEINPKKILVDQLSYSATGQDRSYIVILKWPYQWFYLKFRFHCITIGEWRMVWLRNRFPYSQAKITM